MTCRGTTYISASETDSATAAALDAACRAKLPSYRETETVVHAPLVIISFLRKKANSGYYTTARTLTDGFEMEVAT
jgi:hypothetical protein